METTTAGPCPECDQVQDRGRFCGHCGALLVPVDRRQRERVGTSSADARASSRPAPTGRRRRVPLLAGLAVAAVGVAVVATLPPPSITLGTPDPSEAGTAGPQPSDEQRSSPTSPSESPTAGPQGPASPAAPDDELAHDEGFPRFLRRTDTVLLFDDGLSGGITLDLDTGATMPVSLPQRPGDQPYRLWRLGERVVVGWGEIRAVSLAGDVADVRALPDATVFVPAAEPDQLWLVDHASGRTDGGAVTATLVDADGSAVAELEIDVGDGEVLRGVPGGLAIRTAEEQLVRVGLDGTREVYPSAQAQHLADAAGGRVVWCDEPCTELQVSDVTGRVVHSVAGYGVSTFDPASVWLAPDGERIAAVVTTTGPDGRAVGRQLRVHLVEVPTLLARASLPEGELRGSWTPDGRRFVHALSSPPGSLDDTPQQLGVWAVGGSIEQVDVTPRLDGLGDLVALPRHAVGLDQHRGTPDAAGGR